MRFLMLAWRNLSRKRRQTFQNAFSLVFSLALTLFMIGYMDGMMNGTIDQLIRTQSGHLKVYAKGYSQEARAMPLGFAINHPESVVANIRKHQEVEAAAPRIRFACMLKNGPRAFGIMGQGIDPQAEERMGTLKGQLTLGPSLTGPNQIVLGRKLAEDLRTWVGQRVQVITSTSKGQMQTVGFQVVGIYDSGLSSVDANLALIRLEDAQALLAMPDRATEIGVLLHHRDQSEAVVSTLTAELSGRDPLEILSWQTLNKDMLEPVKRMEHMPRLIAFVMLLSIVPSIMNTLMMSVSERFREIGAMRAMGMHAREVLALFLVEGFFLGILASGAGVLIGGGLSYYFSLKGLPNPGLGMGGPTGNLPYVYPTCNPLWLGIFLLGGTFGAVVAYFFPARMAANLDPIKALRSL